MTTNCHRDINSSFYKMNNCTIYKDSNFILIPKPTNIEQLV